MESERFYPIVVIIRRPSKKPGKFLHRSVHKFNYPEDVETFYTYARKKFPQLEIFKVNLKIATPPETNHIPKPDEKLKINRWYCPYCATDRIFYYDEVFESHKCEVCMISDNDFHVRKYNNLWPSLTDEFMKAGRRVKAKK